MWCMTGEPTCGFFILKIKKNHHVLFASCCVWHPAWLHQLGADDTLGSQTGNHIWDVCKIASLVWNGNRRLQEATVKPWSLFFFQSNHGAFWLKGQYVIFNIVRYNWTTKIGTVGCYFILGQSVTPRALSVCWFFFNLLFIKLHLSRLQVSAHDSPAPPAHLYSCHTRVMNSRK